MPAVHSNPGATCDCWKTNGLAARQLFPWSGTVRAWCNPAAQGVSWGESRSTGRAAGLDMSTVMGSAIPSEVVWGYLAFGVVFVLGLVAIVVRRDWQNARGFDKLLIFGPIFYAAPIATFGTEHFTLTAGIERLIPAWIPWHFFWMYFIGVCFFVAALSLVTGIKARLAASLLALTFFLFVALMHGPGWARHPENRFVLAVVLRETSFSGGALALAVSLGDEPRTRLERILATIARLFVAVPILYFSVEQFLHGDHVPGIPLQAVTPEWIFGHEIWTYLTAAIYAVAGLFLLVGRKSRAAAICLGATVLFLELVVYVPIGIREIARLDLGLNYVADTLMFCGTLLLLARAMPRGASAVNR